MEVDTEVGVDMEAGEDRAAAFGQVKKLAYFQSTFALRQPNQTTDNTAVAGQLQRIDKSLAPTNELTESIFT